MKLLVRVVVCVLAVVDSTQSYGQCYANAVADYGYPNWGPWHAANRIIPVRVSTSSPPWTTVGMTEADFVIQVKRTLSIINEQGGGRVFLRYDGPTSASGFLAGQVVIRGDNTTCNSALAQAPVLTTFGNWGGAALVLRKFSSSQGQCPAPIPWGMVETFPDVDVVGVMMHELLHGVFDFDHPDAPNNPTCADFGQLSIIRSSFSDRPGRHRTMKAWDVEVLQGRIGHRGVGNPRFFKNFFLNPGWSTGKVAPATPNGILYAPGSVSQRITTRVLGYVANTNLFVMPAGGGTGHHSRVYSSGLFNNANTIDGVSGGPYVGLPKLSIASKHDSAELIAAFLEYLAGQPTQYGAFSDVRRLCWRRSTNGAASWGDIACDNDALTGRYGVTVTYDAYSNAFLVGYIADDVLDPGPAPASFPAVAVLVIPAIGSSTQQKRTITSVPSYTAPSIACDGTAAGCRVVFPDVPRGHRSWYKGGVSVPSGDFVVLSFTIQGFPEQETPSLAWIPAASKFVLASTQTNDAIFAYTMTATGNTWTGAGDIWNNGGLNFVSPAAMAVTAGSQARANPWWLKYW